MDSKIKYKAKFIKESFGDKYTVEAGKEFVKSWTFRNEGEEAWPKDTRFVFTNGIEIGETSVPVISTVNPGDHYTVKVTLTAPKQVGTYCAFYRLAYGKNKKFGAKVWVDICVSEAEDEIARLQREMEQFYVKPSQIQEPIIS